MIAPETVKYSLNLQVNLHGTWNPIMIVVKNTFKHVRRSGRPRKESKAHEIKSKVKWEHLAFEEQLQGILQRARSGGKWVLNYINQKW